MKIFIVAIDHGKAMLTNKLYDSLLNQSSKDVFIDFVVVENSGRTKIDDYIFKSHQSAFISSKVVFLDNLGYFGSAAEAIDKHMPLDATWIIICNNDLCFDSSFVSALKGRQNEMVTKLLLCPDIIEGGAHVNPLSRNKYPKVKALFWDFYYSSMLFARFYEIFRISVSRLKRLALNKCNPNNQDEGEIYLGHGAIFVINPELIKLNNGLPCETFLYQEESVICSTVRKFGQNPYYIPDLKVFHESHATLSSVTFDKDYEMRRSAWWATRRHLMSH